jgi:glycerol-3-phosphate dehydrogenase subunit B
MFYDVIIIGAGLAGLMAAESAASAGAKVLLLARGLGSLPLTTGCIDLLGYYPSTSPISLVNPLLAIKQLARNHPYARMESEEISTAMRSFQKIVVSENYPYMGSENANILIPTSLGSLHPTCLVPETMEQGNLSIPESALLLGFEGLKDFFPTFIANNLTLLHEKGVVASTFRSAVIKRPDLGGKATNTLTLAQAFDNRSFRESLVKEVHSLLRPGERIGIPAVLGFTSPREVWMELQERVGAKIFEIPLPPPSVPGLRLYHLLKSYLQKRGVRFFVGFSKVTPFIEKNKIAGLTLGEPGKNALSRASAFVLATGQFVGGGLDSERNRIFETLFDLPIRYPEKRKEWFRSTLLTPEGQPFNGFGVEVDRNLQPVDFQGRLVYSNLFAAGGIIAHADSMNEKSGGGVAIATGYKAGKSAVALAKNN